MIRLHNDYNRGACGKILEKLAQTMWCCHAGWCYLLGEYRKKLLFMEQL